MKMKEIRKRALYRTRKRRRPIGRHKPERYVGEGSIVETVGRGAGVKKS